METIDTKKIQSVVNECSKCKLTKLATMYFNWYVQAKSKKII
jgi:hypothetical protein